MSNYHLTTKRDLDAASCSNPDCDHTDHDALFLHAACHPRHGLKVSFNKMSGLLHIDCLMCGEPVCAIVVGDADPQ